MSHNHTLQSQSRIEPAVRAALYVRVSTQEQADRWGLKAQRTVLTKLAEDRGWDPIFYDEGGASGETIAGRPVFQRLLADVAAHRIDLVAVVEMELGAELLFEVVSRAYERQSLLVTTNLPFEEWTEVFGSQRLTGALLDRLTHRVHILEANGDSYRLKEAKKERKRTRSRTKTSDQTPEEGVETTTDRGIIT